MTIRHDLSRSWISISWQWKFDLYYQYIEIFFFKNIVFRFFLLIKQTELVGMDWKKRKKEREWNKVIFTIVLEINKGMDELYQN